MQYKNIQQTSEIIYLKDRIPAFLASVNVWFGFRCSKQKYPPNSYTREKCSYKASPSPHADKIVSPQQCMNSMWENALAFALHGPN